MTTGFEADGSFQVSAMRMTCDQQEDGTFLVTIAGTEAQTAWVLDVINRAAAESRNPSGDGDDER